MGVISYSIYMVHFLLLKLAQNFVYWLGLEHPPAVVGLLLTLGWSATVTMVAAGIYWAIERPARNWCREREAQVFGVASLDRN